MKRRFTNLLLALLLIVAALPVVAAASSVQVSKKGCNHRAAYEKRVEILEEGTCQEPGKVKYECTYSVWYLIGTYECDEEWVEEEILVTCHPTEVEAKAATCTEPGNTAGLICSDCGWDKTKCAYCAERMATPLPVLEHTVEQKPYTAPTCVEPGTNGGTWCSVCKTIIEEPSEIPATGVHNYNVLVENLVKATCKQKGKDLMKCATCDGTSEVETTFGRCEYELLHYHEGKEPTCTTSGVGAYKCKHCGNTTGITADPLGHDRNETVLKAVTCTEDGYIEVTCKREGCNWKTVETVEATGHTFETAVPERPATCTADGYTAHMKCNDCDATEGKEVLDTDGHNFVNYICTECGVRDGSCTHGSAVIRITNATCKATGKETFDCPTCGYHYEKTLAKLTYHNYVNGSCSWCGVDACNHSSTSVEKADPTCTEQGYERTVCNSCGKILRSNTKAALGHVFNNSFCSRCGHVDASSNKLTIDLWDIFTLG